MRLYHFLLVLLLLNACTKKDVNEARIKALDEKIHELEKQGEEVKKKDAAAGEDLGLKVQLEQEKQLLESRVERLKETKALIESGKSEKEQEEQ